MHIAVDCLLGLAYLFAAPTQPHWHSEYHSALKHAHDGHKALLIVLGRGPEGWRKLVQDEGLPEASKKLLVEHYVCLYVDVGEQIGKQVADAFEADRFPTMVLSDSAAKFQVFRETGPMTAARLTQALERYSGHPERAMSTASSRASTTETNYCRT
jgi:hypothetical protein